MAAPHDPLEVCIVVYYPQGFANPAAAPTIGVLILLDPLDVGSSGLLARIERCQGNLCSSFALRTTHTTVQFPSGTPQMTFLDFGEAGIIYRYRLRIENSDGVTSYITPIQINTTTHNTTTCTGAGPGIAGFNEYIRVNDVTQVHEFDIEKVFIDEVTAITEFYVPKVFIDDLTVIIEFGGHDLPLIPPPPPPVEPPGPGDESFGCIDLI